MRKWAYNSVVACPEQAGFADDRVYSPGSVDGPDADSPGRPFIVIRFGESQPPVQGRIARIRQQTFQVWLHMEPGSMLPIDELCDALEKWMPSQAPALVDGQNIIACEWQFTSSDSWDDHYKTEARYITFMTTFKTTAN